MIYRITYTGTGDKRKSAHPVRNREELMALRNSQENLDRLAKARQGDETAKADLLQLAYNIGHVEGLLAGCKSQGSFFFHDVDCYGSEYKDLILSKKEEIGLVMLEKSAKGGWHLVCRRVPGTTILENQVRVATILHVEMDTNTKDLQRVSFSTSGSEDDLPYLDDAIFEEPMSAEECEQEYQRLKERERKGLEQVPKGAKKANKHYRPWEEENVGNMERSIKRDEAAPSDSDSQSEVIPANDRTRFIFRECMKEEDVTEADLNEEGGRHNSVKVVLSHCNLLLTEGETLGVLKELMPDNWNDQNIRQLVKAYYTDYYNGYQRLTLFQKKVFRESRRMGNAQVMVPQESTEGQPSFTQDSLSKLFASATPPEIPASLPRLVKTVLQNTPQEFKATVAQAMFPPLATYPRKLSFVYIDNQPRELRINCLIIAPTGSGKDSCTKQPLIHIISEMKKRDKENRKRLKEFNDEFNGKAGNKEKPKRPEGLIIQTIKSDITKAALVQRMDEADSAPLYVRLNELEQWDQIEAKSGRANQFTTMKLCDDEDNDYGSDRAGTQSVMADGCLHLNWNANTTLGKAMRYFKFVLTDGPISRLCLATIPVDEDEYGTDISVFGKYGQEYDDALKPYIDNLKAATGEIDCSEAKKLARKLKKECAEFARLSQDRVFDNLSHRALVHAFRKACLLYAANGMKWERSIEGFCRWSLFYDLYLKMKIWGDKIRHADDDIQISKRGPQSLLTFLPERFTEDDAKHVRTKLGMNIEKTGNMISTWKKRHYVVQMADGSFEKVSLKPQNNE